ncbi:MAG: hypothetical protein GX988_01715 [Clostridiales bacterium]|nr:hypothetical protein [Clostridiales bacterium]
MSKIDPKMLKMMLNMVSKKSGKSPEELLQALESGNVEDALSSLCPNDAQKIQQILKSPNVANQILSSPEAQGILRKISGQEE